MLVIPDEGVTLLLGKMLKDALSSGEDYTLKLYQNDYTPVPSSTAASFTECTFGGYAAKPLTRAGWGTPSLVSGKASTTYSVMQTWTLSGSPQTVYGYFVLGAITGKVLWAEKFAAARTLTAGDQLDLTPVFTLTYQI